MEYKMAEHIPLGNLSGYTGQDVSVCGWVESVRRLGGMNFIVLRDRSGKVQVTFEKEEGSPLEERISALVPNSTVYVTGIVNADPRVKLGGIEIRPSAIDVTSVPTGALPINDRSKEDERLDWRFLALREPKNELIFRVQTTAEHAMRAYWIEHGFIEIHSPKLVAGATESGSELFQLDYFGQRASLAQSPQFYKQMAMAAGLERVFEIGPVFRANPSHTVRHDTEFTGVDMEMSWISSPEEVMEFEESWLQHVLSVVAEKHGDEIQKLFGVNVVVPTLPFPKIPMGRAYEILTAMDHSFAGKEGDLDTAAEKLLSKHVMETHEHEFVFVTEYPVSVRPFYHMRFEDRPNITRSFDLLWNGLEITTGAQREHRYEILLRQAEEKGVDTGAIAPYLGFFKYGCPPHGGFGFGLSRMLMQLFKTNSVRDVTYVYRNTERLIP